MLRVALAALVAIVAATPSASAQPRPVAAGVRRVEVPAPRTLSAADLEMIARTEPFLTVNSGMAPLRRAPNDYSSFWNPRTPIVPAPPAEPSDGAFAPQAVYGYQPRMTTNFEVPDPDSVAWFPADCTIAAGSGHLVVAYNSRIDFYTKGGSRIFTSSINGFLGGLAGWKGYFDPKVVYDEGSGRFYFLALDIHLAQRQARWTLAVSVTGDPTQGWYVYDMRNERNGLGVDYEELGFGPRGIYLSGNYLNFQEWGAVPGPAGPGTNTLWVLDKAALLAGQPSAPWVFDDVTAESGFAIQTPKVAVVHTVPFGGVDGFMTGFQSVSTPPNTLRISVWGITLPGNFPTGAPILARTTVDTDDPGSPPNASQAGGPARLQTNNLGLAAMNLQFRDNSLVLTTGAASGTLSRARVIQMSCAWPTVTLGWVNDFLDGANFHFWPQVAVNARGQVGLAYCRSGTGEFANFRWTTRTPDDSGFLASSLVKSGDNYVGSPFGDTGATLYRWGDYSGAAVDPVSQGFWFFGMYGARRTLNNGDYRMWVGYVPRAVYVDLAHGGSEFGTTQRPWNTMSEAINDAFPGNDVVVKAGTYATPTTLTKPMTIFADGGTVTLQP